MWRPFALFAVLLAHGLCIADQTLTFQAKLHRSKSSHKLPMVDKLGTLIFDNGNRKLSFKSDAGDKFEIGYDAVTKVVFDVTTHMRGGSLSQVVSAVGMPGAIAGCSNRRTART